MLILKMRLRQEWHIRWVQESFADLEMGMSSSPQVRQEMCRSGGDGGLAKREVKTLEVRFGGGGFVALVVLSGRVDDLAEGSAALTSEILVDVVLLRAVGRAVVLVDTCVAAEVGSVLRRSILGFSAVEVDLDVLVFRFLFSFPSFAESLARLSISFWKSRRSTMEGFLVL